MTRPIARLREARRSFVVETSSVDGRRITFRRSASLSSMRRSLPPLVLIPGVALSGRYMLPAASLLARHTPVWVPDPPGFGRSDPPSGGIDVVALADSLAHWIRHLALPPVALLGSSMGCQIATELAVRHPELVDRLVLQGPAVDANHRTLGSQVSRLLLDAMVEPPSLPPLQVADWITTGPRHVAAAVRAALAHRIEERLPMVPCPTLVVRGARDPIAPERWTRAVADLVPRCAGHRQVPRAAHTLPYSRPLELERVVAPFVGARE